MPEMPDLLPCPFCGSTDLEFANLSESDDYFVSCKGCEVQQIANYTPEEAVRRWNTRMPPDAEGIEEEYKHRERNERFRRYYNNQKM